MLTHFVEIARKTPYPPEAFVFIKEGLDYTVAKIHGKIDRSAPTQESHHVSGRQLCEGLREFAVERYGLLARSVLARWHIYSCEDFGKIVFALVENSHLSKTDSDTIDDFRNVFDFADAFPTAMQLSPLRTADREP